jgi:hypothetical protein
LSNSRDTANLGRVSLDGCEDRCPFWSNGLSVALWSPPEGPLWPRNGLWHAIDVAILRVISSILVALRRFWCARRQGSELLSELGDDDAQVSLRFPARFQFPLQCGDIPIQGIQVTGRWFRFSTAFGTASSGSAGSASNRMIQRVPSRSAVIVPAAIPFLTARSEISNRRAACGTEYRCVPEPVYGLRYHASEHLSSLIVARKVFPVRHQTGLAKDIADNGRPNGKTMLPDGKLFLPHDASFVTRSQSA